MKPKRPIDQLRDSAGSMKVGSEEEGALTGFVQFNGRLLVIKEKAVYEVKMADDIDPERINPDIPNSQQRIFSIGSGDRLLGCTLLTAHELFQPKFLPDWVDCEAAMEATLSATRELVEMDNIRESLTGEIESAITRARDIPLNSGFEIPSILNLDTRSKTFLNRAHHFIKYVLCIIRIFYGSSIKKPDSVLEYVKYNKESDSEFLKIVENSISIFRLLWEARNLIEHPKDNKCIIINDFTINYSGHIKPPTIEIIHPKEALTETLISSFLNEVVNAVTEIFELLVACLCGEHAEFGNFQIGVMALPEDQRRTTHVGFSYAIKMGNDWKPIG